MHRCRLAGEPVALGRAGVVPPTGSGDHPDAAVPEAGQHLTQGAGARAIVGSHPIDAGQVGRAREVLEAALVREPYDRDLLTALIAYDRAEGRNADVERWSRRLRDLEAADS